METSPETAAIKGETSSLFVPRRWRRRRWLVLAGLVMVVIQVIGLVRGAFGVRAVVYNDGPAALEETVLACAGTSVVLGGLEAEESRYEWLRAAERTAVVGLTWSAAGERHEGAWAVARGERLTLRVRSDGEVTVSREQSLGRKLLDAVAGD